MMRRPGCDVRGLILVQIPFADAVLSRLGRREAGLGVYVGRISAAVISGETGAR